MRRTLERLSNSHLPPALSQSAFAMRHTYGIGVSMLEATSYVKRQIPRGPWQTEPRRRGPSVGGRNES